jgi:hypothetical protein
VEAAPFIVRVVDAHGNGVGGHPISWAIVSDVSASLDEDFTLTDAAGEAIVTLTLPLFDVGPVEVEAIASGLAGSPALFTVTMLSMPSSPLSAWVHNAPAQAPPPPPPPSRTRVPSVMASPGYRMTASPLRIRADASLTGQA